jgi:hypothetical protein
MSEEDPTAELTTMCDLEDRELSAIFLSAMSELAKRKLIKTGGHFQHILRKCGYLMLPIESIPDEDEDDEDGDFYDGYDDDWDHDGWESGRTPNDDRSDSMNPNSPSYNP